MANTTKKNSLFLLTLTALFCALIIALTFIPYTGYIVYGGLSITTLHIVVIIGAILLGPVRGTLLGTVWGITCLIYALMNGTADAVLFTNPMISVVPRILVGLLTSWYFIGFSKLFNNIAAKKKTSSASWATGLAALFTAICGTLTNTALVLTALTVFGTGFVSLGKTLTVILQTALALNGVVETIAAALLVPSIVLPLTKMMKRTRM